MKRAAVLLLLVAGTSAALLYYSRHKSAPLHTGTIPALLSMAPPDTSFVLYMDLVALRSSPFLAQLVALSPAPTEDPDYAEFVRATGFNYARDLDRVLLALRPASQSMSTLALAEGRFDRERIARYALRSGRLEKQNGAEVYVVPTGTSWKTAALTFLAQNRIALADGPNLASMLSPRQTSGLDPLLRAGVARVAGSAFFAVGRVAPLPENFSFGGWRSDQLNNLLRSLRWLTLAAQPQGDAVRVVLEGECDTSENARQLAGLLDGLRWVGRAALADPKTQRGLSPLAAALLETLVRSAEVSYVGQRVRVSLELTPQILGSTARRPEFSPRTR